MKQYVNKNCPVCGGYVVINALGDEMCEKCHYILPTTTHAIISDGEVPCFGKLEPEKYVLRIDVEMIKLSHKELEIEFELDPNKLDKISTIIINGHKYVKE